MARHHIGDPNWHFLEHNSFTHQTKWIQIYDGMIKVRVTQPDALTYATLEQNKREANDWDFTGGWGARKHGAVIARVPTILDNELKLKAGYDPTKSGAYDEDRYNSFLDDIDYKHLRTGGKKIGKRKAAAPVISKRFMAGAW